MKHRVDFPGFWELEFVFDGGNGPSHFGANFGLTICHFRL